MRSVPGTASGGDSLYRGGNIKRKEAQRSQVRNGGVDMSAADFSVDIFVELETPEAG